MTWKTNINSLRKDIFGIFKRFYDTYIPWKERHFEELRKKGLNFGEFRYKRF